ncbi:hypothetical protein O181_076802 [Austropuccinia psidii MF-1]|uniref:Uncharacterized protein n=1 Tax=Austropuccinia psidii MF-1 TaxID=1389203 RepID=A0A9Q3IE54_9BASI|nr:hypothetical protein [Austropuccinia psidii MF-1]
MGPKGAKGGRPLALKARWVPNPNWAHLSPILATITRTPKMAINHHRPQIGQGPPWTTFQPMVSGNHQRHPDQLRSILPLNLRRILHIPPCTPYSRLQGWCIYSIIYHYAPFLLNNSMVMVSGPNFMIPTSRSQSPIPILKEDSSAHQFGNPWRLSEDYSRIPTTCPCRSWVGSSIKDYSRGRFSGVLNHFNPFSRHKVLQDPLDSPIGPYR